MAEHRAAFEYDWRARFRLSLRVVGRSMSWGEALRLTQRLALDTSSEVGAAVAGWRYPVGRHALVAMDHYDAFATANFKRAKPYPRPWDPEPERHGKTVMTIGEMRSFLDQHRGATSLTRDGRGRLHDSKGRFVSEGGEVRGG